MLLQSLGGYPCVSSRLGFRQPLPRPEALQGGRPAPSWCEHFGWVKCLARSRAEVQLWEPGFSRARTCPDELATRLLLAMSRRRQGCLGAV